MNNIESTAEKIIRVEERKADGYEYKYELTVRESKRVASFSIPLYSVSVKMTQNGNVITYAKIDEVFSDVKKANAFFDKIVKNLATPIDLSYVLEDSITV